MPTLEIVFGSISRKVDQSQLWLWKCQHQTPAILLVIFSEVSPLLPLLKKKFWPSCGSATRVKDFQERSRLLTTQTTRSLVDFTPGRQPIFRWHKSSLKWAICILIATSQVRSYPGNLSVGQALQLDYNFTEPRLVTDIQRRAFAPIEGADGVADIAMLVR